MVDLLEKEDNNDFKIGLIYGWDGKDLIKIDLYGYKDENIKKKEIIVGYNDNDSRIVIFTDNNKILDYYGIEKDYFGKYTGELILTYNQDYRTEIRIKKEEDIYIIKWNDIFEYNKIIISNNFIYFIDPRIFLDRKIYDTIKLFENNGIEYQLNIRILDKKESKIINDRRKLEEIIKTIHIS